MVATILFVAVAVSALQYEVRGLALRFRMFINFWAIVGRFPLSGMPSSYPGNDFLTTTANFLQCRIHFSS